MTDRRVKQRDYADCEEEKNEMCRVHVCDVERSRDISNPIRMHAVAPAKNSQRILDFALNDKNRDPEA